MFRRSVRFGTRVIAGSLALGLCAARPEMVLAKTAAKTVTLKDAVAFGCAPARAKPTMVTMPNTGGATVGVTMAPFAADTPGCIGIAVQTGNVAVTAGGTRTAAASFAAPLELAAAAPRREPLLSVTVGQAFGDIGSNASGLAVVVNGLQVSTSPRSLPNGSYTGIIRRHNTPSDFEVITMTARDGILRVNPTRTASGAVTPFALVVPTGATLAIYQPGTPITAALPPDVRDLPEPDATKPPKTLDPTPPHDFPDPGSNGLPAPTVALVGIATLNGPQCNRGFTEPCTSIREVLSNGPGAPAVLPIPPGFSGTLNVELNIGYMGIRQTFITGCHPSWQVSASLNGGAAYAIPPDVPVGATGTTGACVIKFSTLPKNGKGTYYSKELVFGLG